MLSVTPRVSRPLIHGSGRGLLCLPDQRRINKTMALQRQETQAGHGSEAKKNQIKPKQNKKRER